MQLRRNRDGTSTSIVVIRNYHFGPIRRYHAERKTTFYTLVDPISPPSKTVALAAWASPFDGFWWRRRVPPPGPIGLLRYPFIAIAGEPAKGNIESLQPVGKTAVRECLHAQHVCHARRRRLPPDGRLLDHDFRALNRGGAGEGAPDRRGDLPVELRMQRCGVRNDDGLARVGCLAHGHM